MPYDNQAFVAAVKYADALNDEHAENNYMGYSMDWVDLGPLLVKKYLELIGKPDTLDTKALKIVCKAIEKLDLVFEQTSSDVLSLYLETVDNG